MTEKRLDKILGSKANRSVEAGRKEPESHPTTFDGLSNNYFRATEVKQRKSRLIYGLFFAKNLSEAIERK